VEIIDREGERAALEKLARRGPRRLALLYGRRRVGKTYLLTHLWDQRHSFYFTASATPPKINRRVLVSEAAQWSGQDLRPEDHPTWRTVFRSLLELRPDDDIVIVLDEVQYLATDRAGLLEMASELNAVWEGRISRTGGVLLVLSGSAIRTLEALKQGGSPLYGRLDWSCQLFPFDYYDAGQMVAAYGPVDRVRTYAAFGGVPKYLSSIETGRSVDENVVDLLLSPSGAVRLQLETVLTQEEGLRDYTTYQGILQAIGTKRRSNGEIASALGATLDSGFRRMTGQLAELGFIEGARNFDEPANQPLHYRIADPALRMFYGLVLPNESAIATAGAGVVWRDRLAHQVFPTYVGQHVFEDVVRQAYIRHWEARSLPPVAEWGRWAGKDKDRQDAEIDIVARLLDGGILTGSAKMRHRPADANVLLKHIADLRRLADSGRGWAREALEPGAPMLFASTSGFKKSFTAAAADLDHPLILWEADDLF
jgi:AAA+ ATPase superfamily predicted ATPase